MFHLVLARDPADERHFVVPGVGEARVGGPRKLLASNCAGCWAGRDGIRSLGNATR